MEHQNMENIVRLGPRIPVHAVAGRGALGRFESIINTRVAVPALPNHVLLEARSASTTSSSTSTSSCGASACELPTSSTTFTLPIVLGVAIPIIGAAITFILLQRRHVKKQREEDANDRHASMDFGLGDIPQQPGPSKRKKPEMTLDEKPGIHMSRRQVSMDMNLTSPYLLPPEVQGSRASLHSLSRTIPDEDDPYRPVMDFCDNDSSRTAKKNGSSIYTSSTTPSKMHDMGTSELLSHAGGMPRSTPPSAAFVPPPRQNSLPQKALQLSPTESVSQAQSPLPPYPLEPARAHLPNLGPALELERNGPSAPLPGHQSLTPAALAISPRSESFPNNGQSSPPGGFNNYPEYSNARDSSTLPLSPPSRAPERALPNPTRKGPPMVNALPASPHPARKGSLTAVQPQPQTFMDDESEYGDGFKVTPPSPGRKEAIRGQRYSMDVPPEEFANAGLGAPGFDAKRISIGFRPLPPDAALNETDDPEIRANRIRSFYKEYFDDSKPAPKGQYVEDYEDDNYLGDAAYFDPETNTFVMPYSEPVTRRAMTPPPRGPPKFQGPPRGRNGSVGAMSVGGGRGPSQMYPPGPYPRGPKAHSTASGGGRRGPQGPKRPIAPPRDLNTLPIPSKLRDDTFILNPMDFAPPTTARERVAGRSESPFGERRPYSPAVPAFAPVVSAFDELAPIPSPHLLRKSGTFTSLDFAPPKRFRDADNTSDAGSIRSNRSGISTSQLGAIRSGAYRVSRIQKDVVFTRDDMAATLKPQWGMRAHN